MHLANRPRGRICTGFAHCDSSRGHNQLPGTQNSERLLTSIL